MGFCDNEMYLLLQSHNEGWGWSKEMKQGRKLILIPLIKPLHKLCEVGLLIPQLGKLQLGEVK